MPFKAFFLSLALTAASVGSVVGFSGDLRIDLQPIEIARLLGWVEPNKGTTLADHAPQMPLGKVWVICNQVGVEMVKAGAKESAEAVQAAITAVFQTGLCIQTANGFPITASRELERVVDYEGDILVIVQVKLDGMAEDAQIFSWSIEPRKVKQDSIQLAPGQRQASLHFVSG
jgi:hypothetical protein